jgi:hypothetical protein
MKVRLLGSEYGSYENGPLSYRHEDKLVFPEQEFPRVFWSVLENPKKYGKIKFKHPEVCQSLNIRS